MQQFFAIYRLVLRHQITRGRAVLIGAITAGCILIGATVLRNVSDPTEATVIFVFRLGLGLTIPVVSLMLGSRAMGEWYDDETLVYVWLRPVRRSIIALAAIAAALSISIPANLLPMVATVLATGEIGNGVLSGTVAATTLITIPYTAAFVVLGITVKRPLAFGLIYVFIWEFFISRGAEGAARLSINSYGSTILSNATGIPLTFADRAEWATTAIPAAITIIAVLLATLRLQRMEVA